MKKIYLASALLMLLFSSCARVIKTPYIKDVYLFDYSKYSELGFFFSESNSVNFDYVPIGSVAAYNESGYEVLSSIKTRERNDDVLMTDNAFLTTKTRYSNKLILANRAELLEEVYNQALKKGANGVINLKFVFGAKSVAISGMAVKR